jgi:hypothetical protein
MFYRTKIPTQTDIVNTIKISVCICKVAYKALISFKTYTLLEMEITRYHYAIVMNLIYGKHLNFNNDDTFSRA